MWTEQGLVVLFVVVGLAAVCACSFISFALRENPPGTREGASTPLEAERLAEKQRDAA